MFSWSLETKIQGWLLILSVTKLPKESLDSGGQQFHQFQQNKQ